MVDRKQHPNLAANSVPTCIEQTDLCSPSKGRALETLSPKNMPDPYANPAWLQPPLPPLADPIPPPLNHCPAGFTVTFMAEEGPKLPVIQPDRPCLPTLLCRWAL